MNRRALLGLGAVILLLVGALASPYLFRSDTDYQSDQFLMDTLVSIKVYGEDAEILNAAVKDAYAEMRRIAELADAFAQTGTTAAQGSDVFRLNALAGKGAVRVSDDVMAMLLSSKAYASWSNGAFDVTVGPLMKLWDFGGDNPQLPTPERIEATLKLVGGKDLVLSEKQKTAMLAREGMRIDLGGVAKGYATERALQVLKGHGIKKALIDAGGNIRVLGRNRQDAPWRIGIKDPRKADAIIAVLQLEDASAVTSADYYRDFQIGGKRYHHILDPRTGYPAAHCMSATVITRDAGVADILSTVFFVLPPEKALELAEKLEGVDLVLVTADRRIRHTASLKGRITLQPGTGYHYDQGR